jgi:hypothetical protein
MVTLSLRIFSCHRISYNILNQTQHLYYYGHILIHYYIHAISL